MATLPDDIRNRFVHHAPPDDATAAAHDYARRVVIGALEELYDVVGPSRERAEMTTQLEYGLMFANKAIAMHGPAGVGPGPDHG